MSGGLKSNRITSNGIDVPHISIIGDRREPAFFQTTLSIHERDNMGVMVAGYGSENKD